MNLTKNEAAARAALIGNVAYQVKLDLTGKPPFFTSHTRVTFESRQEGANSFIDLIASELLSATLNGVALNPAEYFQSGRLQLPGLQQQNQLEVVARCTYSHTGEGLHRFVDPVDQAVYLYTQFEPADARRVFAVFEQPDLKATFQFQVTTPTGWKVFSNQPEAPTVATPPSPAASDPETSPNLPSHQVHVFEPTPQISSYLTAIAAGPWAEWHSEVESTSGRRIPLGIYARQSMAQYVDAEEIFQITKQGFGFYEPAFAYPYPFTKYDQIFCPEYNFGAMENVGLVTITENYIFRSKPIEAQVERRATTILHELAHMWFGDLVTMRWWDDLWLNESFAEFISALASIEATRWQDAWATFAWSDKLWAYQQDQLPTTHPILAPMSDLDDVRHNFDGITYAKGASVLRQLVAWVGQEAFLAGLRNYFAKHAWGNTELGDLMVELEAASGRDLGLWAEIWLHTTGVNTIITNPEQTALAQKGVEPEPSWRPQRLALGGYSLVDGDLIRTWETQVDLNGPETLLPHLRPCDLLLINESDLGYAKVRLDPKSLQVLLANVGRITDTLSRAVAWGSLWDMTRDAELSPRWFAQLVLEFVDRETNSTGTRQLLELLSVALNHYTPLEWRTSTTDIAADHLWTLANNAQPGSDAQLQLVKAFARQAGTGPQIDLIEELATGSRSLTGLEIDTDLRWDLLMALVVLGRAGEDDIAQQLASDNTQTGLERAAGLRAALPNPEAKAAAWQQAVERADIPNATQRAVIAGFTRVKDPALLKPFVEPYFAALKQIWRNRAPESATIIAEGLYPSQAAVLPGIDVLGATDRFLEPLGADLAPLRRLVLEGRANLERSLAVQAAERARYTSTPNPAAPQER